MSADGTAAAPATAELTAYETPADRKLSLESPHVLALPNGKLLVALDQSGPDVKDMPGKKKQDARKRWISSRNFGDRLVSMVR